MNTQEYKETLLSKWLKSKGWVKFKLKDQSRVSDIDGWIESDRLVPSDDTERIIYIYSTHGAVIEQALTEGVDITSVRELKEMPFYDKDIEETNS